MKKYNVGRIVLKNFYFVLFGAVFLLSSCTNNQLTTKVDFIVSNAKIITMRNDHVVEGYSVVIDKGIIVAIESDSTLSRYKAETYIDAEESYLMPGLADMHVHIRMDPDHAFKLFLANGVTTVRNMGLDDGKHDHIQLREKVANGSLVGPRYLITGPQINAENTYSLKIANQRVIDHLDQNYDFMKIHGDLKPEVFDYLMHQSDEKSIRTTGHLQHERPLSDSLDMYSVEHTEEFLYAVYDLPSKNEHKDFLGKYRAQVKELHIDDYRNNLVQEVKKSGKYVIPTLTIYHALFGWVDDTEFQSLALDPELQYLPNKIKEGYLNSDKNPYRKAEFPLSAQELKANEPLLRKITQELHNAGVPLVLGVDGFGTVVPGFSIHRELELLVDSGLTPYEALETGTINVARYLGEENIFGTIEAGKKADLILLKKNPLTNIENTRSIWSVFTQGNWLQSDSLLGELSE